MSEIDEPEVSSKNYQFISETEGRLNSFIEDPLFNFDYQKSKLEEPKKFKDFSNKKIKIRYRLWPFFLSFNKSQWIRNSAIHFILACN